MNKHRLRIPLVVLLVLQMGACVTWQTVETSPVALLQEGPVDRVRITRPDGVQLTLLAPRVRAGALVATGAPGAVLLEDVMRLEVERTSVLRTVGLVLPAALVMAIVGKLSCRC